MDSVSGQVPTRYAPCHIVMVSHLIIEWLVARTLWQVFPVGSDHHVRLENRHLMQAAAAAPSQSPPVAASSTARDSRPAAHIDKVGLQSLSSLCQGCAVDTGHLASYSFHHHY